jgi:hypothetical protein
MDDLHNYSLSEGFKRAWRAEFGPWGSVKDLGYLIALYLDAEPATELDKKGKGQEDEFEFVVRVKREVQSGAFVAKIRKFFPVARTDEYYADRLSPYHNVNGVADGDLL